MGFQLSPGIEVREFDLTTSVPAVSTTVGAVGGVFQWGPVEDAVLVSSEDELVKRFGKPTSGNFETFYTASNFLQYGNQLLVSRAIARDYDGNGAITATALNASVNDAANTAVTRPAILIKNFEDYQTKSFDANSSTFYAKYPGDLGNTLKISVCDSVGAFSSNITQNTVTFAVARDSNTLVAAGSAGELETALDKLSVGDLVTLTSGSVKVQIRINSIPSYDENSTSVNVSLASVNTLGAAWAANTLVRSWEYANLIRTAPRSIANSSVVDGLHVVVADEDGLFSGVRGQVLEVFTDLSRATDATSESGVSAYFKDVLNTNSRYVWAGVDRESGYSALSSAMAAVTATTPLTRSFLRGATNATTTQGTESGINNADLFLAYDVFKNAEEFDISLLMTGKAVKGGSDQGEILPNYLIDNIAEVRRDLMVFVSPSQQAALGQGTNLDAVEDILAFRNVLRPSTFAFMDGNYKYQYDRYNNVYRWIPLNGDIAGLAAATDQARDPWYSFAGFNRGVIKNVVKLAFNPDKADRDTLYQRQVNPVVSFPGEGTVLFGDRTVWTDASAFQYANVRRLFIVLEKAIARSAKRSLFEFNNTATRAAFVARVEPFLRNVQSRNGIFDFKVVCDTTNNTGEVIDRGEFIGDIYVKPARSINFVQLNFVAVKTDVEFNEIVGQF